MKITLNKWLLGQCGREDAVGKLARHYVNESDARKLVSDEVWFEKLEKDSAWSTAVTQTKKEFAVALDFLSRGKSAPTFPKWFASEEADKRTEESFIEHKKIQNCRQMLIFGDYILAFKKHLKDES